MHLRTPVPACYKLTLAIETASPLLRLPDELLVIIFKLVLPHAQRDGPFVDTSCLVVSKRRNRLMEPTHDAALVPEKRV